MTDIAVEVEGRGPALVLLHAFPLHAAMWRPQASLSQRYSVVTPDVPGFGRSRLVAPIPDLSALARALHSRLRDLGFQHAIVAGCSMGGYLAFALLRVAPQFITGLALINTRAAADSEQARTRRYATIDRVQREGVAFLANEWPQSALSPVTMHERPEVVSAVRDIVRDATCDGVSGALQAMAQRPDATPQLAAIRVPTIVVHGVDDPIIPLAEAKGMAEAIRGATFIEVPRTGHLPNMEEPASVMNALRELASSRS